MTTRLFTVAVLLAASPAAWPAGALLLNVDHCHASPNPSMRAECEQRRRELERAHARERQQKELDEARARRDSTLCFTRKATQERVCPN